MYTANAIAQRHTKEDAEFSKGEGELISEMKEEAAPLGEEEELEDFDD